MTYPWGNNRRFNAASNHMRNLFGTRVQKLTIDAGFTCPNRDGTISTGGCSFCNNQAFNPSYCNPEKTVTLQLSEGISFHERRYKSAGKYLAYFQAYSNTYGKVDWLEKLYTEALTHPQVAGLIIGTRPDCINNEILDLLQSFSSHRYVLIEFGIESVYNKTLLAVNRGHTFEDSVKAIEDCAHRNILCGGHVIFGLPGETREMMMDSAKILSSLPLNTLKLHQLQIIKGTKFEQDYLSDPGQFELFSMEEYINFIGSFISYLSPSIILERLAGETQPWHNTGPKWNLRYDQVLSLIEKKMEENNLWQGKNYQPNFQLNPSGL